MEMIKCLIGDLNKTLSRKGLSTAHNNFSTGELLLLCTSNWGLAEQENTSTAEMRLVLSSEANQVPVTVRDRETSMTSWSWHACLEWILCSRIWRLHGVSTAAESWSEMQTLRSLPDLLSQNLHFDKIPS